MTNYDLIIIGAGAAGLMCAANIKKGVSTLILEKTTKIGTKLKISGSGQCNITHSGDIRSFEKAYGSNGRFLRSALHSFSNEDLVEYFTDLGVPIIEREDGKMFPESLRSGDIVSALVSEIKKNKNEILKNSAVVSICFNSEISQFDVKTEDNEFTCKNLVISTGGASYPQTGSTGDGYRFAKDLGHRICKTSPSLTSLSVRNWKFATISGNSFKNASISIKKGSKKIVRTGELLITHNGLSGPLILDFSRYLDVSDKVSINFLAKYNLETAFEKITNLFKEFPARKIGKIILELGIPASFSTVLLELSGVSSQKLCGSISKKDVRKICLNLCQNEVDTQKDPYEKAMCTTGGVDLREIDPKTMGSKMIPGLFFCGETLDLDGDTGGYNIQAAFSTAQSTATAICNKY